MSTGYVSNYPSSGHASESQLRNEFQKIQEALEDTISRSGDGVLGGQSNSMESDLDLDGNDILNVNIIDVQSIISNGQDYTTSLEAARVAAEAARDAAQLSESNVSAMEATVQALSDNFRGTYYGSSASDPSVDPLGNAPTEGDLYFNTTTNTLRLFDGSSWNLASVDPSSLGTAATYNLATNAQALAGTAGVLPDAEQVRTGHVAQVATIADLRALEPAFDGQQVEMLGHTVAGLGGGMFYADFSNSVADDNGVTVVTIGGKRWVRKLDGFVTPEMFGAIGDGVTDNTPVYNSLINSMPDGTLVVFGTNGHYLGNFVSADKSFRVDLNGATLTDTNNNVGIVQVGAFDAVAYDVVESVINNGDTQFTVIGASGLFSVGDIGYLWDQAVRPTGGSVNYEVVKIADITGDVITVEGFIASHKGAAAIKFYHSSNQLKGPEITNGHIKPSATHVSFGAACFNSEHVSISRIQVEGATGDGIAARFCYDVDIEKIKPLKPRATGSGQGYGVALFGVSHFRIKDVIGLSNRHVYDQDSAYFGDIENVSDMDDQSAPVVLAHNGFAGYISCKNVRVKTSQYPVSLGSQGYGGTPSADKNKHPFRNITIDGVDTIIRDTVSPNGSTILGVYFENSVENVDVRNIRTKLLSETALASGAGTCMVRVDGISRGYFNLSNVDVNKIGLFFFSLGTRDGLDYDGCIANFRNLRAGAVYYPFRAQGLWAVDVDNVSLGSNPIGGVITYMEKTSSDLPQGAYIGGTIQYPSTGVEMLRTSGVGTIPGVLPKSNKAISSSIVVSAGQALTQAEIQERGHMIMLTSPVGAGTVTLSATTALPAPTVRDIELKITQPNSGRQAVEFPAGNNIAVGFTIAENEVVHLYQVSGKWQLLGRYTCI